jgi:hypothetical protein
MSWGARLLCAVVLLHGACGAPVDIAAVPAAILGCEAPNADNLSPKPPMLPGRHCQACHTPGGQAGEFAWTASGTVFARPDASCDTGGLSGVKVEIADATNLVVITLYTNRAGNFYTSEDRDFSKIRVRISKDDKVKEMVTFQPSADCPSCHYPGGAAGGRIFLD